MEPTEQDLARLALQFMARANLTGQEVSAFNHVIAWLEKVDGREAGA